MKKPWVGIMVIVVVGALIFVSVVTYRAVMTNGGDSENTDLVSTVSFYDHTPFIPVGWELFEGEYNGVNYSYAYPSDWQQSGSTYNSPDGTFTDSSFTTADYQDSGSVVNFKLLDGAKVFITLSVDDADSDELLSRVNRNKAFVASEPTIIDIDGRTAVYYVSSVNMKKTVALPDGSYVAIFEYLQPYEQAEGIVTFEDEHLENFYKLISSFHFTN